MRRVATLVLVVAAGVACVAAPSARTSAAPAAALQLSQTDASPGTSVRLQAAGFKIAEYVEIGVTDPAGRQTTIGRVIADGRGDVDAQVAPAGNVKNGVSLISLSGTDSGVTASAPVNVTGGSDGDPVGGQPGWTMTTSAPESSCEQCLLVHGQAP